MHYIRVKIQWGDVAGDDDEMIIVYVQQQK